MECVARKQQQSDTVKKDREKQAAAAVTSQKLVDCMMPAEVQLLRNATAVVAENEAEIPSNRLKTEVHLLTLYACLLECYWRRLLLAASE